MAIAVVALANCGGDDDSAANDPPATDAPTADPTTTPPAPEPTEPASTTYDPCQLVSQEQADAVMGTALQAAVPAGASGDSSCTYTGPPEGSVAQLEVFVGPGAEKFLDIDKELGHVFTPVTGIGDEAEIQEGSIFFRVGDTWAAIRIVTLDEWATFQPRVEDLARDVASRM